MLKLLICLVQVRRSLAHLRPTRVAVRALDLRGVEGVRKGRPASDTVMAGHSRSKNGVASLAYVPAIPLRQAPCVPCRDARDKPGHDESAFEAQPGGGRHDGPLRRPLIPPPLPATYSPS